MVFLLANHVIPDRSAPGATKCSRVEWSRLASSPCYHDALFRFECGAAFVQFWSRDLSERTGRAMSELFPRIAVYPEQAATYALHKAQAESSFTKPPSFNERLE